MPPISQLSDAYASSTYELDLLDNLTLPAPEDSTTDPSYSQQTLASIPCSSPSQPLQPPSFPSFLQRVGPDRRKPYFLYSHMSKDQFVAWWLTTDFGKQKRIHWDGRHSSQCWEYFDQVADMTTGEPKVMCNRCAAILEHPQNSRHGTSTMNKHTRGINCRRSASKKPNIQQLIRNAVSPIAARIYSASSLNSVLYRPDTLLSLLPNSPRTPGKRSFSSSSLYQGSPSSSLSIQNSIASFIWHD
jgi:hypothetical protein